MTQKGQSCVYFAMECGDGELASFGLKVNQAALHVYGSGGVTYSHFYWLVLGAHWLSDGWFRCIKAQYSQSKGVLFLRSCVREIEEQR